MCIAFLFCCLLVIPLKSELAYKILERGRMRFWLQAEEISSNVTYKFFANNKELSGADVRDALKMTCWLQAEKNCVAALNVAWPWFSQLHVATLKLHYHSNKAPIFAKSIFECIRSHFTTVFFCSPTRWVMTSLQASLSSSWTISLRRMREHLPARSLMEEAKHRARLFWLEMVR